jgi:nitroimidazol reductase NimA-like FMN-containing flavoprotein (pyridoxamine 5'-phosphate oxidase superfamily)
VPFDEHGLEIIKAADCRSLLKTRSVGHLGTSIDALPVVMPVFYGVDGDYVVLRSMPDTPVGKALEDCVVCLEVDSLGESGEDPWGVVVTGQAQRVTSDADIARLDALGVPDVVDSSVWVRIPTRLVLGRRLRTA